ncbi:hypothetical protein SLA2020_239600 [Shorea laevis]
MKRGPNCLSAVTGFQRILFSSGFSPDSSLKDYVFALINSLFSSMRAQPSASITNVQYNQHDDVNSETKMRPSTELIASTG